jgi:hypothetical protein
MSARFLENDRLADLLVALETEGLGEENTRELDRLIADHPGASRNALAGAASAALLAVRIPMQPLPPSLHGRLVEQGRATVRDASRAPARMRHRSAVRGSAGTRPRRPCCLRSPPGGRG